MNPQQEIALLRKIIWSILFKRYNFGTSTSWSGVNVNLKDIPGSWILEVKPVNEKQVDVHARLFPGAP